MGDEIVASSTTNATGFASLTIVKPGNYSLKTEGLAAGFLGAPVHLTVAGEDEGLKKDLLVLNRFKASQETYTLQPGIMGFDEPIVLDRRFAEDARLQAAYAKELVSLLVQITWTNSATSWADLHLTVGAGNQGYKSQDEEHGPTTSTNIEEARIQGPEARVLANKAGESFWIWVFTEEGIVLPPGLDTTIRWEASFTPER